MITKFRLWNRKKHDRRGRPRKLLKSINERSGFTESVDLIAEAYWEKGSKKPIEEALKEVAAIHEKRELSTIRRYYKEGLADLSGLYASSFTERVQALLAEKGIDDTNSYALDWALHAVVRDSTGLGAYRGTNFNIRKAYARGKRIDGPNKRRTAVEGRRRSWKFVTSGWH